MSFDRWRQPGFLAFAMFAFVVVPPVSAQIVAVHGLKKGDCVQFSYGGGWETATISGPEQAGGYPVDWGAIKTTVPANSRDLRACPAGANAAADVETKAASKRLPTGNGIGAQYGTRDPATCTNRKTVPASAAVAMTYVKCDTEGVFAGRLYLTTDLKVQVGSSRPFNFNQDSMATGIDARQPVYDIRGSYTQYQCDLLSERQTDFAKTHNCMKYPAAAGGYGRCFKDTFGDWHCQMTGGGPTQVKDQLPPRGN